MKKKPILIIIGASAGGMEALFSFFDNTLPDGASYVVTTHLHPDYVSLLSEMVQKHSILKVSSIENAIKIKANEVYVMPENKTMLIKSGHLLLFPRNRKLKLNMVIDDFFKSVAADPMYNVIAVILSGMGSDGSDGIKAISESGGTVIVQDLESAAYNDMPFNALNSGFVNFVLNPKEMPEAIVKIVNAYHAA